MSGVSAKMAERLREFLPRPDNMPDLSALIPGLPYEPGSTAAAAAAIAAAVTEAASKVVDRLPESEKPESRNYLAKVGASLSDPATVVMLRHLNLDQLITKSGLVEASAPRHKLLAKAIQLQEQGELFKAHPILCELAFHTFFDLGPDDPKTLDAVFSVLDNLNRRDLAEPALFTWLLPRAVEEWGVAHPHIRILVSEAAVLLCDQADPRAHFEFNNVVMRTAQQLPGGLGWGTTTIGPVPDEDLFAKHSLLQAKADDIMSNEPTPQTQKLAKDILTRCAKFYESLGSHWLATVRKVHCLQALGALTLRQEGLQAAEPLLQKAKFVSQRELGISHDATLDVCGLYGETLCGLGRCEAGLSLIQKTVRLRQAALGPYHHHKVFRSQIGVARALRGLHKLREAANLAKHVFELAVAAGGPHGARVGASLRLAWQLLHRDPTTRKEADQLKRRAERLGCDVSECV